MSECDDRRNKIVGRSLWKREDKSASTEIVDALEIVKHEARVHQPLLPSLPTPTPASLITTTNLERKETYVQDRKR